MTDVNEIDYGPLQALIGTWTGSKGLDVAPEPGGLEESPYYETIVYTAAGTVTNASTQTLALLRYHQVVTRKSNDEVFHDEIGYWMWDPASGSVMHSLLIPRAVGLLAGGTQPDEFSARSTILDVSAALGSADWGIVQSPFMRDKASTEAFHHRIAVDGDRMMYEETTVLAIYGRRVEHTDGNELTRA